MRSPQCGRGTVATARHLSVVDIIYITKNSYNNKQKSTCVLPTLGRGTVAIAQHLSVADIIYIMKNSYN